MRCLLAHRTTHRRGQNTKMPILSAFPFNFQPPKPRSSKKTTAVVVISVTTLIEDLTLSIYNTVQISGQSRQGSRPQSTAPSFHSSAFHISTYRNNASLPPLHNSFCNLHSPCVPQVLTRLQCTG